MGRRFALVVFFMLGSLVQAAGQRSDDFDSYGGRKGVRRAATGYFRTTKAEGRWWLVDPYGNVFISVGVNGVSLGPRAAGDETSYRQAALEKYRKQSAWAKATVEQLRAWGFNTLGKGCDRITWEQGMAYTVSLSCARTVPWAEGTTFPDVFDPDYETAVRRHASRVCRSLAKDPALLGYFTDVELQWEPDETTPLTILEQFLGREDEAPGRKALLEYLEGRYLNIDELNENWGTEYADFEEIGRTPQVGSHIPEEDMDGFLRLVAREYFRIAYDAIRSVDEHHLILGCEFDEQAPVPVLEAMGDYVNLVSLRHYGELPPTQHLREVHRVTGWPVLITSFGFSVGRGEEEKPGEQYERYVRALLSLPMVVGYHWSEYVEPARRIRTEAKVSGLVDQSDTPTELIETARRVNRAVYQIAAPKKSQEEKAGE